MIESAIANATVERDRERAADKIVAALEAKQRYETHRMEVATRLLIAAVQDNVQDLNPRQIVQVCVALADELLAELLNPMPRHRS